MAKKLEPVAKRSNLRALDVSHTIGVPQWIIPKPMGFSMDFPSETLDFYGLSMFLGAYPFF